MRPKAPLTPEMALDRLQALCARSEQCSADLMRKLHGLGLSVDQAERVIDSLIDEGFVDDARYAVAYVRDKYRFARWGRQKIKMGLIAKRIARCDIDSAMEAIDPEEYQEAMKGVIMARIRTMPRGVADTYEGRQKLLRLAASRGYEIGPAIDMINSLTDSSDDLCDDLCD